jgi:hypothetical protein
VLEYYYGKYQSNRPPYKEHEPYDDLVLAMEITGLREEPVL